MSVLKFDVCYIIYFPFNVQYKYLMVIVNLLSSSPLHLSVAPCVRNKTQLPQSMLDKKELTVDIVERPSAGYNTTRTPRKIIITASQFIFHTEQHCTIRSRPRNICLLGSTFHHCTAIILLYVSYRILTSILSKVYIFKYIVLVVIDTSTMK